jgi:predicted enzyme related to lactoylglutathione lyase
MSTGRFWYHELRVPDVDAGATFYGELFGWTAADTPVGKLLRVGETVVGGVSAVKPNVPAHWSGYVTVDDVAATVTSAKANGGIVTTEDSEPVDAPGQGLLAPFLDTVNTALFVVTSTRPTTSDPRIGTFVWNRLHTTDPTASVAFYQDVLPWAAILNPDGNSGGFRLTDGTMAADMVPAGHTQPRWLAFVLVDDLDRTRARATELGARVVVERARFPGDSGDFGVITDPQGVEVGFCQAS